MATQKDFIEFFESKKKGIYLCPVCASHIFLINVQGPSTTGDDGDALLAEMKSSTIGAEHAFYGLSCQNCGTTTFVHRQQFYEWLEAKKKAQEQK